MANDTGTTDPQNGIIPEAQFYSDMGLDYEGAYGSSPGLHALLNTAKQMLSSKTPARILDAGCGTGRPTSSTMSTAGHEIHGIDIAENMLALSAKHVPNGTFEQSNILTWEPSPPIPKENGFDAIFALFSLFLMSRTEIEAAMDKFSRWLKPGGVLFLATIAADDSEAHGRDAKWHPDGKSAANFVYLFMGIMQSMTLLTKAGWKDVLESKGLKVLDTKTVPYVPPEGVQCDPNLDYYIIARRMEK